MCLFLIHSAMIRLPLFENGEYYFCLNFWSDDYDAFTWTHVEQLQRLVRPLAGELRERLSFTEEKALPYTPAGSGFERLSLCPELAEVRQRIELAAPTRTTVLILGKRVRVRSPWPTPSMSGRIGATARSLR